MAQGELKSAARPRGRPRSFDADEVLDKARAVFWNLGYAATSLDDLTTATGLNRPSLYGAFGNKHALYLAALERSCSEATAGLAAALATEAPLREVLTGIFHRTVKIYRQGEQAPRGCFLVGTAVTQAVDDPEARDLLAQYVTRTDALFRARLERDATALTPGLEPAAAGAMASGTLHTLAVRARMGADEPDLKVIGLAAVDMICGARS